MSKLTICMVTRNRLDYTKRTIESLLKTVPDARWVIFDNASTEIEAKDYLCKFAENKPDDVILLMLSDKNIGWGGAHNYNRKECLKNPSDYILFTDNDVIYEDGWFEKLVALYEKYPKVGVMAVWKHTAHGVLEDKGELIVKDQMPGCGWLLKKEIVEQFPFAEHGTYENKGGIGEDVNFCIRIANAGYLIAAPKNDVAQHITGY